MKTQGEKKVTIDDVARRCEVSKTTISRFLNGKYENISADTRKRIQKVIIELDYQPNRSAQRLKASKSMLIGCIIGDISSPFSALLLKGIINACEDAGYQVLFADCDDDPAKERSAIDGFVANRVDGLIVNTSGGNEEHLLFLNRQGTPIVLADRSLIHTGLLDTVTAQNRVAAYDCVKLLGDYGYDKVAFFTEGNRLITPRILRYEGYCDGVGEFLTDDAQPELYEFNRNDTNGCSKQLRQFRDKHPGERIAILCVNGVATQHVLMAFKDTSFSIGYDYGLCGFDDWNWLQLAPPGITSVAIDTKDMGARAAKLLIERIDGKRPADSPPALIELPNEIIVRGSTVSGE